MHKGKELLGCVFRNVEMGVFSNCRTRDMSLVKMYHIFFKAYVPCCVEIQ